MNARPPRTRPRRIRQQGFAAVCFERKVSLREQVAHLCGRFQAPEPWKERQRLAHADVPASRFGHVLREERMIRHQHPVIVQPYEAVRRVPEKGTVADRAAVAHSR